MTSTLSRAPSSVGNPIDVRRVVQALVDLPRWYGGATVNGRGGRYLGDGILVALPEHGTFITPGTNNEAGELVAIRHWVESVAPVVSAIGASPARYFGAWRDGGKFYLDVVEAYSSAEEDRAVEAGRARNQIAVWHNGRQVEIPTGGNGQV